MQIVTPTIAVTNPIFRRRSAHLFSRIGAAADFLLHIVDLARKLPSMRSIYESVPLSAVACKLLGR